MRKALGWTGLVAVMVLATTGCPKDGNDPAGPKAARAGEAERAPLAERKTAPAPMHELNQAVFSAPVIAQPVSMKGDGERGMARIQTPEVDQLLQWNPVEQSLQDKAAHERTLVQRAAENEAAPASVSEITPADGPGMGSLRWSAAVADTRFRFAVIDCGAHHVLLTSMGPDEDTVEQVQRRSLGGFTCKAAARSPLPTR